MLRFLTDENFSGKIIRGLLRREPAIDILSVRDAGLTQSPDPDVLEWAATESRIVLTHDVQTMAGFAYNRVTDGLPMPGVVEVPQALAVGKAIEAILMLALASFDGEYEGQVYYIRS